MTAGLRYLRMSAVPRSAILNHFFLRGLPYLRLPDEASLSDFGEGLCILRSVAPDVFSSPVLLEAGSSSVFLDSVTGLCRLLAVFVSGLLSVLSCEPVDSSDDSSFCLCHSAFWRDKASPMPDGVNEALLSPAYLSEKSAKNRMSSSEIPLAF